MYWLALIVVALLISAVLVWFFKSSLPPGLCEKHHKATYWVPSSPQSYYSPDKKRYYSGFRCRVCDRFRHIVFYRCDHPDHEPVGKYFATPPERHIHDC